MAPAIVHFLVGGSILLVLASPVARHDDRVRRAGLWLVVAGGVWGLLPDIHNIVPVYQSELRTLHDSPWSSLFAFHYALDHPVVRDLHLESIAASIVAFLLAVYVFTAADRPTPKRLQKTQLAVSAVVISVATLLTAVVFGGMLYGTGRVESVATLIGRDSTGVSVAVILAVSALGATSFATIVELVSDRFVRDPVAGSLLGVQLGVLAWLVGIAVVLPLWSRVVLESSLPVPYTDWPSLVALTLAGALVGTCDAFVRRVAVSFRRIGE